MTLVGLLGEGISRSLTPPMHRRVAADLGLEYEYRIIDIAERGETVEDLPSIFREIRDGGFDAINVTHPFKQRIIPELDVLSDAAEQLEAVNLVIFSEQGAVGHNTDWTGYRWAVLDGIGSVSGQRIVQIGAGGAGSATAFALLDLGVGELAISDVDPGRAAALTGRLQLSFPDASVRVVEPAELADAFSAADGAVQATPIGMSHSPGASFDVALLRAGAWVSDVVYLPIETELLRRARAGRHPVLDGGRMAVGQAADSFSIITGIDPDTDSMREHFIDLLVSDSVTGGAQ